MTTSDRMDIQAIQEHDHDSEQALRYIAVSFTGLAVLAYTSSNGPPARGAALNCRTDYIVGAHGEGPERAFRT